MRLEEIDTDCRGGDGRAACATSAPRRSCCATYPTLTTAAAQQAAQAALARCQKDGYTVAVAVVDRGGQPLAVLRDNLAGAHTTSDRREQGRRPRSAFAPTRPSSPRSRRRASRRAASGQLPNVVALGGGLMIRAKGSLVGGIGVSGAPGGDADDVCAKAGIAAISDAIELE